jgi:hypothetical protein
MTLWVRRGVRQGRVVADEADSGRPGELDVGRVVATLWVGAAVCGFISGALPATGLL